MKKINAKTIKLIKFHNFINYNLIYNNKAINRYKKESSEAIGSKAESLKKLKKSILNLKNCELKKNSTNIVFAGGNPKSKIMIIGEGPGFHEDQEGLPFVGRAGNLLDKMLASINLHRENVYITNVVNYRPPENRRPTEEEIKRSGININGPFVADTIFIKNYKNYDAIIGMYHDQVLAPFKALFKFEAINITLGLKYLRASPDHGVALDLIKKFKVNPASLLECIYFFNKFKI